MEEKRNVHKILVVMPAGKAPLGRLIPDYTVSYIKG
jgi:hypothetical protein